MIFFDLYYNKTLDCLRYLVQEKNKSIMGSDNDHLFHVPAFESKGTPKSFISTVVTHYQPTQKVSSVEALLQ